MPRVHWKDVIFGAVITLAVTVFGGVATYYLTREPPLTDRESLVYQRGEPTVFETDSSRRSFATMRAANFGTAPAQNITITIAVPDSVSIIDQKVTSSDSSALFSITDRSTHSVRIGAQGLLPDEEILVVVMLDGVLKERLRVGFRSASSIAHESVLLRGEVEDPAVLPSVVISMLPALAVVQLPLILLLLPAVRRLVRRYVPTFGNVNDTAFLYIHTGLLEDAETILRHAVERRGANALTLANYGLALGLNGKADPSKLRMKAAGWYAVTRHERSVVLFNEALLAFAGNDDEQGKTLLSQALDLSRAEVRRYASFTVHLDAARSRDPDVETLISKP